VADEASTPALAPGLTPLFPDINGNVLVVVDTNVARAVDALRKPGAPKTYEAREGVAARTGRVDGPPDVRSIPAAIVTEDRTGDVPCVLLKVQPARSRGPLRHALGALYWLRAVDLPIRNTDETLETNRLSAADTRGRLMSVAEVIFWCIALPNDLELTR